MATKFKSDGRWYVKYKDIDGVWKKIACGHNANASDAEAIRKTYDAQELNRRHNAPIRLVEMSVIDAMKKYRDVVLSSEEKTFSSIKREKAELNNFIEYFETQNITSFESVTNDAIIGYMNSRRQAGFSTKTRREERRMLRRFFNWAVKNNFCSMNPAMELPLPKLETKKPRYFSEEELSTIFEEAIEPYRTIFKFLYLTGLRTGELRNLEWSDFNERQRYITIRVTDGNKTKREEIVQLNSDALEIIQARKKAGEHDTYIFLNAEGNQLDNDNIYRNLKRLLKRLRIFRASPHTFRHTCASHLVIRGVSIYAVKDILRHRSVKETEIYAHLSVSAARNAVEMLSVNSVETQKKEPLTKGARYFATFDGAV